MGTPDLDDVSERVCFGVKRIVDAKAQFRSLAEPWADTGTSAGRLMLAVLGGLAGMRFHRKVDRAGFTPDEADSEG